MTYNVGFGMVLEVHVVPPVRGCSLKDTGEMRSRTTNAMKMWCCLCTMGNFP